MGILLGNRFVATLPDGRTETVTVANHVPTHAVAGQYRGKWEVVDWCLSAPEADAALAELSRISDKYRQLRVVRVEPVR